MPRRRPHVRCRKIVELIAYLKERPGKLSFGSSGRATSDRLAPEVFMLESGSRMLNVPYRGGRVPLNDMLAGTTQVMFPPFRERMHKIGVEPVGRASAAAEVFFERELARWKRVIDIAKLKLEC